MLKRFVTLTLWASIALALACTAGCETDAQTGALIGTAVGAAAGQAIGGDTKATLIGAGLGAAGGYMIGGEQDKKKTRGEIAAVRAEQNTVTVWITNSNGSQTPVKLLKNGPNYIGPGGEHYNGMPTEEDLKKLYGR